MVILTSEAHSTACYLARKLRRDDIALCVINQLEPHPAMRSWAYYKRLWRRRGAVIFFDNLLEGLVFRIRRFYPTRALERGIRIIKEAVRTGKINLAARPPGLEDVSLPIMTLDPELRHEQWLKWIDVDRINSDSTRSLLSSLAPDLVLLLGSPILAAATVDAAGPLCLNPHPGITPQYGGASPFDWPFYYRDWDKIGFTIHHVTAAVDSGAVIYQERVKWDPNWPMRYLRQAVFQKAVDKFIELALAIVSGQNFPAQEQHGVIFRPPIGFIALFLAQRRKRVYARRSR